MSPYFPSQLCLWTSSLQPSLIWLLPLILSITPSLLILRWSILCLTSIWTFAIWMSHLIMPISVPFAEHYAGRHYFYLSLCISSHYSSSSIMPKGISKHIHNCITAHMHADAQQRATDNFDHTTCAWDSCSTKVHESCPDFITHIQTQLASLTKLLLHENQMCKWYGDSKFYIEKGNSG